MASNQFDQLWDDAQKSLVGLVPEGVYRIWLENLRPVAIDDRALYLEVPEGILEWVRRRFAPALTAALRSVDPLLRTVELLDQGGASDPKFARDRPASSSAGVSSKHVEGSRNPSNTFEQFVIGQENRFAHAAALAVAELPAHAYNPLLLCGPPGTGKTHLLQAVVNYVATRDPSLNLVHLTAETFASDFRSALRSSHIESFKRRHRSADILVVDDVHFLAAKKHTAEEFLYTVDDLVESGSQVVLSSDSTPAAMTLVTEQLRHRLQGGLVAELQPPGFPTRFAVLRRRAPQLARNPDHLEILRHLARSIIDNVRVLEGALIRVHAYASLTQQPITLELANRVLGALEAKTPDAHLTSGSPSAQQIQRHISTALDLDLVDLRSTKRNRQVVYARQVAMYLCRELTTLSLPEIGRSFGGRDHTTVLHAHRRVRKLIVTDSQTSDLIAQLTAQLGLSSHDS